MKIESKENKIIVYYTMILDDISDYEVEDIKTFIKILVFRLKKKNHLPLNGYYHLDVYINKIMILEFEQIDEYEDQIDLNIILHLNHEIMVKYQDFFLVKGRKYYFLENYYSNIENIDIEKNIEFVEFIYNDDVDEIKREGKLFL